MTKNHGMRDKELSERKAEIIAEMRSLAAKEEEGGISAEELTRFEQLGDEVE